MPTTKAQRANKPRRKTPRKNFPRAPGEPTPMAAMYELHAKLLATLVEYFKETPRSERTAAMLEVTRKFLKDSRVTVESLPRERQASTYAALYSLHDDLAGALLPPKALDAAFTSPLQPAEVVSTARQPFGSLTVDEDD